MNTPSERLTADVLACLGRGDGIQAERLARRLVQSEPRSGQALFLLTNSLCLQGRLVEALDQIDRALAIRPDEPDYVVGKAQILGQLGWSSMAIEWYRRATSLRPSEPLSLEFGQCLLTEGYVDESIRVLEEVRPGTVGGAPDLLLGQAYTEAGRFEDAAKKWSNAQRAGFDPRGVLINRITAEITAGRLAVADELIADALNRFPDLPQLYAKWASLRRVTTKELPLVERLERLWRVPNLPPDVRAELGYALGKAYDDLGEYGKAIQCYDAANQASYTLSPVARHFDADAWKAYTDRLIRFFTGERMAELAARGSPETFPLFIVGMIRTGTTMVEHILSSHPQVAAGGETTFWADCRNEVFNPQIGRFEEEAAHRLGSLFAANLRSKDTAARFVTEKNPLNLVLTGMLHCIYPQAKFVHVERDPIDTALSIWMTPLTTGLPFVFDRKNIVAAYRQCDRLAKHFAEALPPDVFRTFAYEDITRDPEATIGEILSYLDLPLEEGCFHPERNLRPVRTPSVWQVRQPLHTGSQAKWKRYERWLGPFAELAEP